MRLSDVLRAVRLTGAVFFDVHASEPWVAEAPPGRAIVGTIFPAPNTSSPYHVVARGTCWGHVVGEAPRHLVTGDVIVFPHGDPHVMSSAPGMRGTPRIELYRPPSDGHLPFTLTMGSERPEPARIVCGFLGCDARPFNPLLSALPHVHPRQRSRRRRARRARALRRRRIEAAAHRRRVRARPPERADVRGRRAALSRVAAGRAHRLARGAARSVRRPRAAALHGRPARDWTLEALAREVGLSRSALAERFTEFVGQPPMQYLANWRMQLAANHLHDRHRQRGGDRRARRLRVGGGVQPRVQEGGRRVAGAVAEAPGRRASSARRRCDRDHTPRFWRTTQIAAARRPCRFTRDN